MNMIRVISALLFLTFIMRPIPLLLLTCLKMLQLWSRPWTHKILDILYYGKSNVFVVSVAEPLFWGQKLSILKEVRAIRTYNFPPNHDVDQNDPAPTVPVEIMTRSGKSVVEVLADSGADICAAGYNFLHDIGTSPDHLSDSYVKPRTVNGSKLDAVGFLRATLIRGWSGSIMGHLVRS